MKNFYDKKDLPVTVNAIYGGRRAGVIYREIEKLTEEINELQKEIGTCILDINRLRKQRDNFYEKIQNSIEFINGNCYLLKERKYIDLDKEDVVELLKILKEKK